MLNETPRFASLPPVAIDKDHMSVLIAVDTSGSVSGEAIRNINANLNNFKRIICTDPLAAKCVDICVISFDDEVKVIQDWCPIKDMRSFELTCGGRTDLSGAVFTGIKKIREWSEEYARKGITERKPYFILMTDGFDNVSDNLDAAADYVYQRVTEGKMKLWFLGFGEYDKTTASKLCRAHGDWCFEVKNGDFNFNDFFDFAANSVKAASVSSPGARITVDTNVGTEQSNVDMVPLRNAWIND